MKHLHSIPFSKRRYLSAFIGCMILAGIVGPLPAAAQVFKLEPDQILEDNRRLPWELHAEEVAYDQQLDRYVARGNVQISRGDVRLTADFIQYDHNSQRAFARGNVVLTVGQDILSGSYMEIDLENQMGFIEDAYLFLKENNFHITAEKIEKTGKQTYRMDQATLTTCDGPQPSWKISARDVKVKEDGAGTAKHAILRARNLPVLYTPFLYYPARKDRQSGFLMPEFGQSDRRGYQYNQPFFWAISENTDATFYGHHMSNRGIKPGAEFRYYLSEKTKGAFMLDGLKDDKTDNGGESSNEYGFRDAGEDVLRRNDHRYWFRMSHHQPVPLGFFAKLDLDIIRDQDYLREFREGFMGYEPTNLYFRSTFNRQLDDYNDPLRTNRLNLNRLWPSFSLNFEPRWNDDTRRNSNTSDTLQRLPLIAFDGAKQKISTTPLYFDLASQYDHFWRDTGQRGQRIDLQPRLYLPFRVQNYLTIEPSAGYRQTIYRLDKTNFDDQINNDRWSHREIFDTRLDFFTEIERVYHFDGQLYEKIKHRIRPQITHEIITNSRQRGLPRFDANDRINETNKFTYGIINTLTSKSKTRATRRSEPSLAINRGAQRQSTADYMYNDLLRLQVQHSYDFEQSTRPFAPLFAKLDVRPGRYIMIDADAQYSVYDNTFLSHNVAGTIWDNRGDELFVDYRFEKKAKETQVKEDIQSLTGKLKVQITDRFSIKGGNEYNFESNQRINSTVGFTYKTQCWSFDFNYLNEPNDWNVGFKIELIGLGEFRY
ncbi:MAG: LPS assembly protein LptD [Desulfobacterales bacterium]|nr:LPS assembly protein LptD [Desulfobacterales bacterium]